MHACAPYPKVRSACPSSIAVAPDGENKKATLRAIAMVQMESIMELLDDLMTPHRLTWTLDWDLRDMVRLRAAIPSFVRRKKLRDVLLAMAKHVGATDLHCLHGKRLMAVMLTMDAEIAFLRALELVPKYFGRGAFAVVAGSYALRRACAMRTLRPNDIAFQPSDVDVFVYGETDRQASRRSSLLTMRCVTRRALGSMNSSRSTYTTTVRYGSTGCTRSSTLRGCLLASYCRRRLTGSPLPGQAGSQRHRLPDGHPP